MNLSLQLQKNKAYDDEYLSKSLQFNKTIDPLLEENDLIY